jgi:hypothetical protein
MVCEQRKGGNLDGREMTFRDVFQPLGDALRFMGPTYLGAGSMRIENFAPEFGAAKVLRRDDRVDQEFNTSSTWLAQLAMRFKTIKPKVLRMMPPKTPPTTPPKTPLKNQVRSKLVMPMLRTTSYGKIRPVMKRLAPPSAKKSSSSLVTLSLTTVGAVALIVACSPNTGKAPITIGTGASVEFQKAITTCTDSIRPSQKLRFLGATRQVNVCEFLMDANGVMGTTPVSVLKDVNYSVQTGDSAVKDTQTSGVNNTVRLAMQVGLSTSEVMDDKMKKDFVDRFTYYCKADTQAIFSRSKFDNGLTLHLSLNVQVVGEDGGNSDYNNPPPISTPADNTNIRTDIPDVKMSMTKFVDGSDTYWAFSRWPGIPRYYPQGKTVDTQACRQKGGSDQVVAACVWAHRRSLNVQACAAFAKHIGNGLGLVDTASEQKTCGAVQPVDSIVAATVVHVPAVPVTPVDTPDLIDAEVDAAPVPIASSDAVKPAPVDSGESTFSKPSVSDDDFMKNATLNKKDLVRILSLPCPNLKTQTASVSK